MEQPTFNAVFAFDSSGSMAPYMPLIEQVKRAYLADRRQDEVPAQILDFTDDRTQNALASAGQDPGWSRRRPGRAAHHRLGAGGYPETQQMWQALASVRPLIFAHVRGRPDAAGGR